MTIINHLVGVIQGKHPMASKRSSHWAIVRKQFLGDNPKCALCNGTTKLEVHHKVPFHLKPELELDQNNPEYPLIPDPLNPLNPEYPETPDPE